MRKVYYNVIWFFNCILMLLLVVSCKTTETNPVPQVSQTENREQYEFLYQRIKNNYRFSENVNVIKYVESVLAKFLIDPQQQLTIDILESSEINAYALPGGHILVTTGLLASLVSEAQLAAVLAHELAHLKKGHVTQRYQKITEAARLAKALSSTIATKNAEEVSWVFATVAVQGFVRENELEADKLAVEYLDIAGYKKSAMHNLIALLEDLEKRLIASSEYSSNSNAESVKKAGQVNSIFADHPPTQIRLLKLGEQLKISDHRYIPEQDDRYLEAIDGVILSIEPPYDIRVQMSILKNTPELKKRIAGMERDASRTWLMQPILMLNGVDTVESLKSLTTVKWLQQLNLK